MARALQPGHGAAGEGRSRRPRCITCVASSRPIPTTPACTTSSDRHCGRAAISPALSRRSRGRSRSIPSCARATTRSGTALKQQAPPRGSPLPGDQPGGRAVKRGRRRRRRTGRLRRARETPRRGASARRQSCGGAQAARGSSSASRETCPPRSLTCERAIALVPNPPEAHYNLGVGALVQRREGEGGCRTARERRARSCGRRRARVSRNGAARDGRSRRGPRQPAARDRADAGDGRPSTSTSAITFLRAGELDKASRAARSRAERPVAVVPPAPTGTAPSPASARRSRRATTPSGAHEAHNVLGLLLGRKGAPAASEVAAEFREAIRLRPDYAEAHNNLGLGADSVRRRRRRASRRCVKRCASRRTTRKPARNLGAALTPTDAEAAIGELEKAVALAPGSVKAQFNLAVAYGASPAHGAGEGDRATAKGDRARARRSRGPTWRSAKRCCRTGKVDRRDHGAAEAPRGSSRRAARRTTSWVWRSARAGRKEEAAAQLKKGRDLVAADDRTQNANLDIAEGRAALERGDLEEAAAKFRHAIQLRPESAEPQRLLGVVLERQGDAGSGGRLRKAVELNPHDLRPGGAESSSRWRPGAARQPRPRLHAGRRRTTAPEWPSSKAISGTRKLQGGRAPAR